MVLSIPAINQIKTNSIWLVIVTDSLLLLEGMNYQFGRSKGFAKPRYYIGLDNFPFGVNDTAILYIKKLDLSLRLLAGIFSFTGTNVNGEKASITEGRFDIRYQLKNSNINVKEKILKTLLIVILSTPICLCSQTIAPPAYADIDTFHRTYVNQVFGLL